MVSYLAPTTARKMDLLKVECWESCLGLSSVLTRAPRKDPMMEKKKDLAKAFGWV